MAFDAFALQHPMKPEAVQSRFLNDDDRKGSSGPLRRLPPQLGKNARAAPRRPRLARNASTFSRRSPATAM